MKLKDLRELITKKYGTVYNFTVSNKNLPTIGFMYNLLSDSDKAKNPTMNTIIAIAEALDITKEEVIDALSTGHRNEEQKD